MVDKVVLWTYLVWSLQAGPKDPQWLMRDFYLQKWSVQIYKKNKASGYDVIFVYKVDKNWIPNLGNTITIAHVELRERLDVSVIEGVEERVLSIDYKNMLFIWSHFMIL